MLSRRIITAIACAVLTLIAGVTPASAARPVRQLLPPEPPLTAEQLAASAAKVAAAEAYVASESARAFVRSTLSCITPQRTTQDSTNQAGCGVPSDFLVVAARDQVFGHYCGPAVGQVIANHTWGVPLNANKYTQGQIAVWMRTDLEGQTTSASMEAGLERATINAPRRPANWNWVISPLEDTDRDWTFGDQLHDYVRSNITGSNMGLAISVKPHDVNGRFHLSSWPRPVNSVGHWISVYGWYGLYDGGDFSRLYYTDSSKDEGGATGKFWDPMRHIGGMIRDHTKVFVW